MKNFVFGTRKRHILTRQNRRNGIGGSELPEPKKLAASDRKLRICGGDKIPKSDRNEIWHCGRYPGVITTANFGGHRFGRFRTTGVEFQVFQVDF